MNKSLPAYLTPVEKEVVINSARDPRDLAVLSLGLNAGLRATEMAQLTLDDIDLDERKLLIRQGKGSKTRYVEINDALLMDLHNLLSSREPNLQHEYALYNKRNKQKGLDRFSVRAVLKRLEKKTGLHLYPHKLRHTCATDLMRNSNIAHVKEHLRHEDIRTTIKYVHIINEELKRAVNKINRPNIFRRILHAFKDIPLIARRTPKKPFQGQFIGRKDELRQLRENNEKGLSTIVLGDRGTGKSELLARVKTDAVFSLESLKPLKESLVHLCEQLRRRGELETEIKGSTTKFVDALCEIGKTGNHTLFIDELSDITRDEIRQLRKLVKAGWTIFATGTAREREKLEKDIFFGKVHILELQPLPYPEAIELIRKASADLTIEEPVQFCQDIYREANGNPLATLNIIDELRRRGGVIKKGQLQEIDFQANRSEFSLTKPITTLVAVFFILRFALRPFSEPSAVLLFAIFIIILVILIGVDKLFHIRKL